MYTDMPDEDRLERLENKLTEIRKLSLGILLLAKEIGKDKLKQKEEVTEVIKAIEEAEEAFVDSSLTDRFERCENILDVIDKRVKGLFLILEATLKNQQKTE
ncbi:MAG: hypothetical protein E3K36_10075 [Candidatus Brocadia sp.]|nr:hypothetical protein [Candidatus Brocadia sp.]